jgi:hypothetical protein
MPAGRVAIPLGQRKLDWVLVAFFAVNLFFITYFIDIEQLTVANPLHFHYPLWPPRRSTRSSAAGNGLGFPRSFGAAA